jgi:uncharacterized protein (DUF58 family)
LRRVILVGGLAFSLLLAGLAGRRGELLALMLPLAAYLAAALFFGPASPRLRARRTVSTAGATATAQAGDTVTVRVEVVNEGRSLPEVWVRDPVPAALEIVAGARGVLSTLAPGERLELEYVARVSRGIHEFGALEVSAAEPSGLYRRTAELPASAKLVVLPRVATIRAPAIRPLRTRGYAGPVPSRRGGAGTDFFGVREYQVGDPRRVINWRVSARHPRTLFSNEFEKERIADVGIILDARWRSDAGAGRGSLFEHSVRASASLADAFLRDGNRVGLLIYGRALGWTFPGYGKVQRARILRALAGARTGESQVFDRLDYLPTRFFPTESQLVLVSPLWPDDLLAVRRLLARGYRVLVVRPDPVSVEVDVLPPAPEVTLAARLVQVERALVRRRLQRMGVRVVDWRVDQPLEQAIQISLGRLAASPPLGARR